MYACMRLWTLILIFLFCCVVSAYSNRAVTQGEEGVKRGYVGIHSSGFKDFLLKPELLRALSDCGFEHPSEGTDRTREHVDFVNGKLNCATVRTLLDSFANLPRP